jgi:hypothetical protein
MAVGPWVKNMYIDEKDSKDLAGFLDSWIKDDSGVKEAFVNLRNSFSEKKGVTAQFIYRPGVSGSLRISAGEAGEDERPLLALVDIIDDDPRNRWLSVCFYGDMITDPGEEGNLVPGGILGEDGYCFDITEYNEPMMFYLDRRIDEAYSKALGR